MKDVRPMEGYGLGIGGGSSDIEGVGLGIDA